MLVQEEVHLLVPNLDVQLPPKARHPVRHPPPMVRS
jgi:hypothetical protein